MALQEGPEADGRHPKVDGLPGFDFEFLLKLYTDPDRAMFLGNMGSRTTVYVYTVLYTSLIGEQVRLWVRLSAQATLCTQPNDRAHGSVQGEKPARKRGTRYEPSKAAIF